MKWKNSDEGSGYAAWKEQVRALAIWSKAKVVAKMDYIHNNPVKRGLAEHPSEWPYSSYRFYEFGEEACLPLTPVEL